MKLRCTHCKDDFVVIESISVIRGDVRGNLTEAFNFEDGENEVKEYSFMDKIKPFKRRWKGSRAIKLKLHCYECEKDFSIGIWPHGMYILLEGLK